MAKVANVPVVLQMEMTECGVACLDMILAYYGQYIPLNNLREDCGVSRDGANALNIVKTARSHGLKAAGWKFEPEDTKALDRPCILHWGYNHFVVLNGWKNKGRIAVLNDPARGTVNVSAEEFSNQFTGICIQLEPDEHFTKSGRPQSVISYIMSRLKGTKGVFAFLTILTAITALLGVVTPVLSRIFADEILSGVNRQWLGGFLWAFAVVSLFQVFASALQNLYTLRVNARFAITSNAEFFWHVLRLPMKFFAGRSVGDVASRQSLNEVIAISTIQKIVPLAIDAVMLVFYFTMCLSYNVSLTIIGTAATLTNFFINAYTTKRIMNYSRQSEANSGKLNGALSAGIEMVETIKAAGAELSFCERLSGYYTLSHNASVESEKYTNKMSIFSTIVSQLSTITIWLTAIFLIMKGEMTVGMFVAFQGFLAGFTAPITKLNSLTSMLMSTRVQMERVDDIMNYQLESGAAAENKYTGNGKLSGEVEFKDVTFGYAKLSPPIIKGFSAHLKPGQTVAFVGASGCGKSTLAKLATGLYEPWSGEILFDGKPISAIDKYTFCGSVAMVDQEISLFEDTVGENIRMWDGSIEDFAITMAAKDADIHETITSRPGGYKGVVQENGKNLSGGQRQRMEIARVLASEPTIVIFDEATSALDAKTEDTVMRNIRNLGVTCIIIAHRLSSIRSADEIIVLNNGEIAERGTHDELLQKNGLYSKLIADA